MNGHSLYVQVPGETPNDPPTYKPYKNLWNCGVCDRLAYSLEVADKCCGMKYCDLCKKELGVKSYTTLCGDCVDQARLDKAELVEYTGGPIYDPGSDRYFENEEEFLDTHCDSPWGDVPQELHPCEEIKWEGVDIMSAYENATSDLAEDFERTIVDIDGLFKFVEEWNGKQTRVSLEPDMMKKITIAKPADWPDEETGA